MGKIVVEKIKDMNLWAKFALVTLSALLVSAFMYEPACALSLPIMHNSSTTTTEGAAQKYGSWGLDKDCTWCHAKNTDNVKLVKEVIDTPNGLRTVLFTRMTASSNATPGVLGNDFRTYAGNGVGGSANICEVCHSQTLFHRYSVVAAPGHEDNKLCTQCHSHADGFKAKGGHLVPAYATAGFGHAIPSCSDATGCHANVNPAAPYPTAGTAPDCRSCHVQNDPTVVGSCASCHGDGTANGMPVGGAAGSHVIHNAMTDVSCDDCHAIGGSGGNADHGKGNRGANPAFVNVTSNLYHVGYSAAVQTCSTATCHENPYGPGSVPSPAWGVAAGCATCHKGAGEFQGNGAPATGSHAIHLNLLYEDNPVACNQCHDGAVSGSTGGINHLDGDIDAIGGYPPTTKHTAGGPYAGTCSTSLCHASPYAFTAISSPVWGVPSGCASCHRGTPGLFQANGAPATGSHAKHLELLDEGAPVTCGHCHEGAEKGVSGGANHLNQFVNISPDNDYFGAPVPKHQAGSYAGYCQNAYCHASPYGSGAVNSPVWGEVVGCASCHNGDGAFDAYSAPATGSHAKHRVLYNSACNDCHAGAVAGINPGNHHSNGFVNVTGGYTASPVTRHPIGTYSGTCANSCHTNGDGTQLASPRWGVAMPANCTGCHGGAGNVTPATAILNTGKHKAHMNNLSTLGKGNNLKCAECHATTVSLASNTVITNNIKHVNQFKDYSGVKAGGSDNYSVADKVCSNVYCHSTGQSVPVYTNMTGSKSWTGAAKFDCNGCHGSYPGAATYFGAPNYPNKYSGTLATANSHERHTVIAGATDSRSCAKCHVTTVDAGVANKLRNYSSTHLNMSRDVAYRYTFTGYSEVYHLNLKTCSTYCHSNVQRPPYPGELNYAGAPASSYAKPAWGDNNTMTCASCHVDMATLPETEEGLRYGSHRRHVAAYTNPSSGTNGAGYQCNLCHGVAYNATTAETPTHADGSINVAFTGRAAGTTYSQGVSSAPGNGYGTCSTSKCHGRGELNWGTSTDLPVCEKCHGSARTALQDGVFKDTGGSNTGNFAGTHVSHLAGTHNLMAPMQCSECHVVPTSTTSFDHMSSMPAKLDWGPLSTRRAIIRGYTSSTVPPPFMAPTYAYGALGSAGTCNNTYCHSGVQIKNYSSGLIGPQGFKPYPTWGDQAYLGGTGCNTCHGYPPGGTHPIGNSCSACHAHVDQSNLAMLDKSQHIDGTVQTTVDECLGCHSSLDVCEPTDPSCINKALIAGHGTHTDAELFLYNLDNNGNIIYEQDPTKPPGNMIPSKKKLSKNDYIDATWIYSISYKKGFPQYACGFCHPMDVGLHKNGILELDLNPNNALRGSVKTKNKAGGPWIIERHTNMVTCNNVYCHSSGFVSDTTNQYQFQETPDWYYSYKNAGASPWAGLDNCAQCHGNSPNTGGKEGSSAHARHVVANHFKDVFDGYSGRLAPVGIPGSGAVHGDPNTSTNFNCNICHYDTVRDSFNDLGSTCTDCHSDTVKKGTMRVYSASRLHIDGNIDVTFMEPFAIKSKAQVRNSISSVQSIYTSWTRVKGYKTYSSYDLARSTPEYVGGTCTTTACHNGTQMEWRTKGPLACAACHTGLPQ